MKYFIMKIVFDSTLIKSLTPRYPWIFIDLYCLKLKNENIPNTNATVMGFSAKELAPSIDVVLYINFILSFLLKL